MDKDVYGFIGVWKLLSDISLGNVVLWVYNWYYIQVELCDLVDYYSAGVNWYLDQIDYL